MQAKRFWHSILYYCLQGLSMLLSFLVNYIMVRKLSVVDYGHASVAISLVATVAVLTYLWSTSSLLYTGGNSDDGSLRESIWSRNIILFVMVALVIIPMIIFYRMLNQYLGAPIILWLFMGFIGGLINDYLTNYFLIKKQQVLSSMMGVCTRILNLILYIFVLEDLYTFAVINVVINSICIFFLFAIQKKDIWPPSYNRDILNKTLHFSLWQAVGIISISVTQSMSSIIIKEFATIEQVSYYNVAYKLITSMIAFESYLPLYFIPLLVDYCRSNNHIELHNYFYKTRLYFSVIVFVVHIVAAFLAKPVIILLFGIEYEKSIDILRILLIYSYFYFLILYYSSYANITNNYKLVQKANIVSGVVIILGAFILTDLYGAYGCAVANCIGVIIKYLILLNNVEHKIYNQCLEGHK